MIDIGSEDIVAPFEKNRNANFSKTLDLI